MKFKFVSQVEGIRFHNWFSRVVIKGRKFRVIDWDDLEPCVIDIVVD